MTRLGCHACRWSRYHQETGGLWCELLRRLAAAKCAQFEYEPGAAG